MSDEVKYFAEVSDNTYHNNPPKLVNVRHLDRCTGFRSVYEYPVETCTWIMDNWSERAQVFGSVNGLSAAQLPVRSTTLFVDIDDDIESSKKLLRELRSLGIAYQVYDSGGRSQHFHIPVTEYIDPMVPKSQREFMRKWGESVGFKVDLSIYHAAGLYRLPGTIHEKTQKPKRLLEERSGSVLSYELLSAEKYNRKIGGAAVEDTLKTVYRLLLVPMEAGGRRLHVYKIASNAAKLGWSAEKIIEHVKFWNDSLGEKYRLTDEVIIDKVTRSI